MIQDEDPLPMLQSAPEIVRQMLQHTPVRLLLKKATEGALVELEELRRRLLTLEPEEAKILARVASRMPEP